MNTTTMQQNKTRDIVFIGIFAALIAICSWISIPTTVPFTLQTMGVFTAVGLLGGKRGSLAVLVYILLGLVGLPVFAGFSGGVGVLFGTTGGYIIGFLASALLMWGIETICGRGKIVLAVSMVLGRDILVYGGLRKNLRRSWLGYRSGMVRHSLHYPRSD